MLNLIIPTYKAKDTLPKALNSLLAQTKPMFLVTLVQDCDGEDYTNIIDMYRGLGLNINLLQTPTNVGPGGARQFGMDHDDMCDYFMFMDSDDILMPRAIEILYREAKKNNADVITSNFIAERGGTPGMVIEAKNSPCTWTHGKIYKAQYLREKNIRFLDGLRLNEDSYFNLVACNCTEHKLIINEVTYLWRENPHSLTRQDGVDQVGFFKGSWVDYIRSQTAGLCKISEILGLIPPQLSSMTTINIYNHMMRAIDENLEIEPALGYLDMLADNAEYQKTLQNDEFWFVLGNTLKAAQFVGKERLIFHKQRFPEWLNQYLRR